MIEVRKLTRYGATPRPLKTQRTSYTPSPSSRSLPIRDRVDRREADALRNTHFRFRTRRKFCLRCCPYGLLVEGTSIFVFLPSLPKGEAQRKTSPSAEECGDKRARVPLEHPRPEPRIPSDDQEARGHPQQQSRPEESLIFDDFSEKMLNFERQPIDQVTS
ncbi:hypothetical protein EVAR_4182_1 [Eumeta japonica]|uniref:Uncharacterized protein n=1 Tax=Eumeta variegata TaxID=151549 RepID=A0A4C1TH15_EUMVA|nr:hypothetical protein EVAR_4182_1 [Eumeta japonica]